ncbi:hypothetical protein AB0K60_11555 [Thermopolyspora sp. NPDC052614]
MTTRSTTEATATGTRHTPLKILAWVWVGVPFAYGVFELVQKLTQLFSG